MIGQINNEISTAARLIASSRHMVAFTGAGISTPSGIPDFRSSGTGLWQADDPMQVASATAFRNFPQRFYNWLRPLLRVSHHALPNAAHLALAGLEKDGLLKAVITQNIDGLHQKAGSETVIELHGSMRLFYCPACKNEDIDSEKAITSTQSGEIPICGRCGAIIRPHITLFEEPLPAVAWQRAEREIANADLLLVAGSSLEVYPASLLPHEAHRSGSRIIVVNYTATSIDDRADVVLHTDVAIGIPSILERLKSL